MRNREADRFPRTPYRTQSVAGTPEPISPTGASRRPSGREQRGRFDPREQGDGGQERRKATTDGPPRTGKPGKRYRSITGYRHKRDRRGRLMAARTSGDIGVDRHQLRCRSRCQAHQ